MKRIFLLTIALITLNSCGTDEDELQPNLSFNIENGSRFASSNINVTNTTTNQNGGYIWEVISDFETQTFTTQDLTFDANRIGDYIIRLKSNQFDIQTEDTITITRPQALFFEKVTLKDIPQNYSSLYFKIFEIRLNGSNSYTYTSQARQNISSLFPETIDWNIDFPGNIIGLDDGSNSTQNGAVYQVEFYDNNDNLITKINPFSNTYFNTSEFKAGDKEFTTTSNNCSGCDYFEVTFQFSFN